MPHIANIEEYDGWMTAYSVALNDEWRRLREMNSDYRFIASFMPVTTKTVAFPFTKDLAPMRQWIGDRDIHELDLGSYSFAVDNYELSYHIPEDAAEDDLSGTIMSVIQQFPGQYERKLERDIFAAYRDGNSGTCALDGLSFFNASHVYQNGDTFANIDTSGDVSVPWILFDSRQPRAVRVAERMAPRIVTLGPGTEYHTRTGGYLFAMDARYGVGYGMPQVAFRSTKSFTEANILAHMELMRAFKSMDGIHDAGVMADTLIIDVSLMSEVQGVLNVPLRSDGTTTVNNILGPANQAGSLIKKVIVTQYLQS
jgi:phage major head subunit gpT-like protein